MFCLFVAAAHADVVGVFDDGREFEAPGVEESSLASHRTRTHDDESGTQYNFVEQAAREAKGTAGGKMLSDLLASGAEVEVVDGAAASGLHDLIKQMFAASAKPSKPKPAALPSVPPDTPVSQLLKMIRQTTHDIPPVTPRRAPPGRGGDADASGAVSDPMAYLDHMDATGLELLEAELLQKLRRVRVAKERRAARSAPNAAPRQASPSFEAADEAAPAAHVTSLSDALSEALGLKPGAALTAPGQTVADLIKQAAGSGASADGDGVDGYAERLAREAQQRERPADEDGEEAEGGDTARVAADLVMQELLQKMMGGGGDGPVVKFEVVMGDGSEVAPSGLSGLLESLRSQMEGSGDDGGQEGEEDDDATNAL